MAEEPKKLGPDALLRQKVKQKRFREGYEDGLSSTHKAMSAAAFVASEEPVEMLGRYSRCGTYHAVYLWELYFEWLEQTKCRVFGIVPCRHW